MFVGLFFVLVIDLDLYEIVVLNILVDLFALTL